MATKKIITILALLFSANAFRFHEGTEDGVYEFGLDSNGREFYRKIHDPVQPTQGESHFRAAKLADEGLPHSKPIAEKRWGPSSVNAPDGVNCNQNGIILNPYDIGQAQLSFTAACDETGDSWIDSHGGRASVSGNVVVSTALRSGKQA